jgi:hypothetical protein
MMPFPREIGLTGSSAMSACSSRNITKRRLQRITNRIPDRGQHLARDNGWYACRSRGAKNGRTCPAHPAGPNLR